MFSCSRSVTDLIQQKIFFLLKWAFPLSPVHSSHFPAYSLTTNWVWEFIWLTIQLFTEDFFPRLVYRPASPLVVSTKQILSGRNKQTGMRAKAAAWMNAGLNWLWHLSFSLVCISRNGPLMCSKYITLWEARNWNYGMWECSWLLKRLRGMQENLLQWESSHISDSPWTRTVCGNVTRRSKAQCQSPP